MLALAAPVARTGKVFVGLGGVTTDTELAGEVPTGATTTPDDDPGIMRALVIGGTTATELAGGTRADETGFGETGAVETTTAAVGTEDGGTVDETTIVVEGQTGQG